MNIDMDLLYCILSRNDVNSLSLFQGDWLQGKAKEIHHFMLKCIAAPEMKKLPRIESVELQFDYKFQPVNEDTGYYIMLLKQRQGRVELEQRLAKSLVKISNEREINNKPFDVSIEIMQIGYDVINKYNRTTTEKPISIKDSTNERMQQYISRKESKGMVGIPFPFEVMNMCTGGMAKGTLNTVLARSGIGKTWFLQLCAAHAAKSGYKGILASKEMAPMAMGVRLDSIMAQISADNFRKGRLSGEEEEKLCSYYYDLKDMSGDIVIFGANDIKNLMDMEIVLATNQGKFDFVLWDSPYLCIRSKSWEERGEFVVRLKELALSYNIPILVSWQLNKTVTSDQTEVDQTAAALTDSIITDADNCFVLTQNKDMALSKRMKISSLKTREGFKLEDLTVFWDLTRCVFTEVSWEVPGVGSSGRR